MNRHLQFPLISIVILFVISGLQVSWADEAAELKAAQDKLARIGEEIANLEESLKNQRSSRSSLEKQLAELEKDMGSIYGELRDLDGQIGRHDANRQRLVKRKGSLLKEISNHDAAFAQQIRLAYLSSRESKLKLLLNQEEPQKMGRYLVMYDYINNARWQQIEEMTQLVVQLKDNERELLTAQKALKQRREVQTQHSILLKQAQKQKQALIGQLEASIKDQSDQLAEHKDQQATLSKLLSSLTNKLRSRKRSLKGMEGSLSWPVEGKLRNRFGHRKSDAQDVRWQGISIVAPRGKEVQAIYDGVVVFADWLRGFGLLMIIDHGGGFLSLYAHTDGLYKQEGQAVERGEIIAVVGDTGNQRHAGLYFEIRRDGKPIDPAKWCVKPKLSYVSERS